MAEEFLDAWENGDLERASLLTTDPEAALAALVEYRDRVHVDSLDVTPGIANGEHVPFDIDVHVAVDEIEASWAYSSALDVQNISTGGERVTWKPEILHPDLANRDDVVLEAVKTATPLSIIDRNGAVLDAQDDTSFARILQQLQERYASKLGEPSLEIRLVPPAGGSQKKGSTVARLSMGQPTRLKTTFDAALQRAAEDVVADRPGASAVVIQPSSGEVLAVASPSTSEMSPALEGVEAPGSVFEIVTAAALLDSEAVSATASVACPASAAVAGTTFENAKLPMATTGRTMADLLASSCDTGFAALSERLSNSALADTAKEVFGLGLNWQTGIRTADGAVPEVAGADKAAAAIGRGEVRLNVLNLASVTATVKTGAFKQPLVVDESLIGSDRARAERSLTSDIASELGDMMHRNATFGTGASTMQGLTGDIGSMAGLATQGSGQGAHAWFTAYSNDLAVAAVAPATGRGVDDAGEVVRAILEAHH
ncbi:MULTISPECIES: penicillin-binding transpeptidase domain-containing protein [Streptomyces]|uniref:Penicillin-binding transpeptidase domain-containing protein n=2 Tax=Streptomyces TaxID=1883 RepID=A0ABU4K9H3_9ACTN|nr:penicillin-binding transpeptidase domain-containing protein [Streptomyces roseolus]MDX2294419.1 penicillin-binding transpeptidase domain-containing protein [Streptomyces roseolus]